jgi:phytoene dehydrogenase-like protein
MGALVRALADAAQRAGVRITTGTSVMQVVIEGNMAAGVVLRDGSVVRASTVVVSADPAQLRAMVGDAHWPSEYVKKIDGFTRPGSIAKASLALAALPRFACLADERGQHGAVVHLLPGADPAAAMRAAFAEAEGGRAPTSPPLEMVMPTATDPSQRDPEGRHHASILVPWSPYDLEGTTWAAEEEACLARVLDTLDAFAPGARDLVVDATFLSPKKLETHFGVTRGHAHHVDDAFVFGDRLPYATPVQGLYACGAGCAPAGGIFAAAGHNAAKRVLADLELGLERTEVGTQS